MESSPTQGSAPGRPSAAPDPAGAHLSELAVTLAGAELASPQDPGRVARLAWVILSELIATACYALAVRLRLAAVIPGGSAAAADEPRYFTGLAAELAAAAAARPADQDRVAAAAWRILSTLGEVTFALAGYLRILARPCPPSARPGPIITWSARTAGRVPDVPEAAPDARPLNAALGGAW